MRPNGNSREHWSASLLRELCSCPLRYRLHRIDGCRPSHRAPGLVLGSTYHEVDFIARAWEHYVRYIGMDLEPTLGRILTALYKPEPVWTHRPEPDFKVLSMASPRVRLMAEAVPA